MIPSSASTVNTFAMIFFRWPPCPPMNTASGRGRVVMSVSRKSPIWILMPGAPNFLVFCAGLSHDDRQSAHGGIAGVIVRATVGGPSSAPQCVCRRVDRGCRAHPRSRRLSSGRCGSCSGRRSCTPDGLAQFLRYDGRRSDSRYRASSPDGGAMCRSGQPRY